MTAPLLKVWCERRCPVVGMIHAPALPGSPKYDGDWPHVIRQVLTDAAALIEGGVDGLMLENFGDVPFFPGRVPAATVTALTVLADRIVQMSTVPLGINCLRNDGLSALAIAAAVGAQFVRVNVLAGARVTDQGVINGIAHDLLRERVTLRAEGIKILADVDVKHSAPLAARSLTEEARDLVERAGADAVIVSGSATGSGVRINDLREVAAAAGEHSVWIGSGVAVETLEELLPDCDGLIVGTSLKVDGRVDQPVDVRRVEELVRAVRRIERV